MSHTIAIRGRFYGNLSFHKRNSYLRIQGWRQQSSATTIPPVYNQVTHINPKTIPIIPCNLHNAGRPPATLQQSSQVTQEGNTSDYVLPFSGMPEAKGLPILGTLPGRLKAGGPMYLYKYIDAQHQTLGDVFKIRLSGADIVFLNHPEASRQAFANEGSTPWHYVPIPWELYNQTYGVRRGVFFMHGDEWLTNRRLLNPHLLRPSASAHHVSALADVARDAINDMISQEQYSSGNQKAGINLKSVVNLERKLYRWSLESLCIQMFGHRCGFLSGQQDEFIDAVRVISVESSKMQHLVSPSLAKRYNLPVWKRFVHAMNTALEKAGVLAEKELAIAQERVSSGLVEPTVLINRLITPNNLNTDTVVQLLIDLIMAAGDTTANQLAWCLYLIGQQQSAQKKAGVEISAATGGDVNTLTDRSLANIPYINGVLKEGLRMYPVAPFILRALAKDAVLGGYHTPAGTIVSCSVYSMGNDSRFYPDALNFIPERWLRSSKSSDDIDCPKKSIGRHHTHAFLPFGIGARSCIGRRMAEVQMKVFLSHLLANYRVTTLNQVHMVMEMLSIPSEPFQLAIRHVND